MSCLQLSSGPAPALFCSLALIPALRVFIARLSPELPEEGSVGHGRLAPAECPYTGLLVRSAAGPGFTPWNASLVSVPSSPFPAIPGKEDSPQMDQLPPMKETSVCQTENEKQNPSQEGSGGFVPTRLAGGGGRYSLQQTPCFCRPHTVLLLGHFPIVTFFIKDQSRENHQLT